jgi:hypothetical protein
MIRILPASEDSAGKSLVLNKWCSGGHSMVNPIGH